MNLVEFLLARIADDEAVAKAATPGPWFASGAMDQNSQVGTGTGAVGRTESFPGVDPRGDVVDVGVEDDGGAWYPDAVHIARHDPARVLAECEAKRRIVEEAARLAEIPLAHPEDMQFIGARTALKTACQFLALPYADHPDYNPEWKP